jgi:hypothetical protein
MLRIIVAVIAAGALMLDGEAAPAPPTSADNALMAPRSGPYGGVPRFDRIRVEDFARALQVTAGPACRGTEFEAPRPVA